MSNTNEDQKTVMVIKQDGTHSLKVIPSRKRVKSVTRSRLRTKTSRALSQAVFGEVELSLKE